MATRPALVIGADGLPQRLQAGDDLGTMFTIEPDGTHLASIDLPATYPVGFSDSRNVDMTGWTTLRPPGDTTLNSVIRIEFSKNSANGGTQRVVYRDADGLPMERTRTGTANVWNGWTTSANRGGVLAVAQDSQTSAALPSTYWEGVTVRQVTAATGGYPFNGVCNTVRVIVAGVESCTQTLTGQPTNDVTTAPRTAYRARQPGADAWGKWQEGAAVDPLGTRTLTYTSGVLTRVDNPDGSYRVLTYTSGVLTQVDSVVGTVTTRRTLTYTSGVLTSTTTAVI